MSGGVIASPKIQNPKKRFEMLFIIPLYGIWTEAEINIKTRSDIITCLCDNGELNWSLNWYLRQAARDFA